MLIQLKNHSTDTAMHNVMLKLLHNVNLGVLSVGFIYLFIHLFINIHLYLIYEKASNE